jgi:5-methylcytosine-specific restriction endonuclease McrA
MEQTVVHHIDPARRNGPAVMENLAVLCKRCHAIAHDGAVNTGGVIHDSTRQFWAWAESDARWTALVNEQTTFEMF